ncbi:N-acetylglucosamine-6-phosphate deacetylase [Anaerocolumna sedimenticola]|uniref:N-acetylglucosamine-6-phosphate deacetylase n=1 Tax=Anaerocolumna sedimenticola TaxID=2696063 RepID=A0A6P1TPE4_9FIRM|nr:N-acetylglucosamine-6-phosphate deacetylase [Anaerocolumna sedimenticola]QHQ61751.1 N-acetylglucosamine-6-phosphate deacetylase [Anaerocolumna sedimenticola]
MLYKNAEVFIEGRFQKADIEVTDGRFQAVYPALTTDKTENSIDCTGKYMIPGFIELHSHGCIGYDFTTTDTEGIEKMCEFYGKNGVTSILATTMTIDYEIYKKAMLHIKETMNTQKKGSRIIGINMEGPFLGADKKGAHDERYLMPIDEEKYLELNELSGDNVRIIDLDPKLSGSMDFIRKYSKSKVISLAHTSCDYDLAAQAIEAGATHITHLFNAMNGLHHRQPGLVGAVSDFDVHAEMICDGIHIHPAVIRLMYKACSDKIILISDSMSAAGLEDGIYELGGQKVYVKNGKATLEDGTIAGSTTTVYKAFKNVIQYGIPVEQAILSATLIPATAIHAEKEIGSISAGKRADFIIMDQNYNIEKVYKDGEVL